MSISSKSLLLAYVLCILPTLTQAGTAQVRTRVKSVLVGSTGDVNFVFTNRVATPGICRGYEVPNALVPKNLLSSAGVATRAQIALAVAAQLSNTPVLVTSSGRCGTSNVEEINYIIMENP